MLIHVPLKKYIYLARLICVFEKHIHIKVGDCLEIEAILLLQRYNPQYNSKKQISVISET